MCESVRGRIYLYIVSNSNLLRVFVNNFNSKVNLAAFSLFLDIPLNLFNELILFLCFILVDFEFRINITSTKIQFQYKIFPYNVILVCFVDMKHNL